jgi:hypothetical protein
MKKLATIITIAAVAFTTLPLSQPRQADAYYTKAGVNDYGCEVGYDELGTVYTTCGNADDGYYTCMSFAKGPDYCGD